MAITLSKLAIKAVGSAVDKLFDRVTARYLGPQAAQRGDKRIAISYSPDRTLQSLYQGAAKEEGTRVPAEAVDSLVDIAKGYLNLNREQTKMKAVQAVQAFLRNAEATGIETNIETVLGGHLADIWKTTTEGVTKILDTEATRARNYGTLEGITKVNAALGVEDPVVCFITVRDSHRCAECTRLHLLPDETTPRVYLLSEVSHGYHTRGSEMPSWSGLHPRCRCVYDGLAPVITERGVVSLKDVTTNDSVLTHSGVFRRVLDTFGVLGRPPEDADDLYRIEFKTPQGRIHKLRVTADHLMMISTGGWKRTDALVPGVDKLQYLFKACEHCKLPVAYDIKKPNRRFCSSTCAGAFMIGKPNISNIGRAQSANERERRSASIRATHDRKEALRPDKIESLCEECGCVFSTNAKSKNKKGHRRYKVAASRFCSLSCNSKNIAKRQWSSPEHRKLVGIKISASMKRLHAAGRPSTIAIARAALSRAGGGPSKDQRRLFDKISGTYQDAVLEHGIGKYFADIAIPSARTVIEWDGGGHWLSVYKGIKTREQVQEYDNKRDAFMRSEGWHVLRYSDETAFSSVLEDVRRVAMNSAGEYSFQGVEIVSIVRVPRCRMSPGARLYDITVEGDASFVVMGLVSHNCTASTIMPGYGFDSSGMITYIGRDHNEFKNQRGQ